MNKNPNDCPPVSSDGGTTVSVWKKKEKKELIKLCLILFLDLYIVKNNSCILTRFKIVNLQLFLVIKEIKVEVSVQCSSRAERLNLIEQMS